MRRSDSIDNWHRQIASRKEEKRREPTGLGFGEEGDERRSKTSNKLTQYQDYG